MAEINQGAGRGEARRLLPIEWETGLHDKPEPIDRAWRTVHWRFDADMERKLKAEVLRSPGQAITSLRMQLAARLGAVTFGLWHSRCCSISLANGLALLGVSAPEAM